MKIALAQIKSNPGDLAYNRQIHLDLIHQAIKSQADLIVFPELSMSGYEPGLAAELARHPQDSFFDPFRETANRSSIRIALGMPLLTDGKPQIAMFIFQANHSTQIYSKRLLHADEKPFFSAPQNAKSFVISVNGKRIAPAICYEALQEEHLQDAVKNKADYYIASVAKSSKGIEQAMAYFPLKAKENQIPILMVNTFGKTDNFVSAGQSSVWNKAGMLIQQATTDQSDLLLVDGNSIV